MSDLKMLAIDLGATSGRGIIGSFDGKKLSLEENHRFDDTSSYLAGTLQWNIADIYENIKTSIKLAGKDIRSIGIDTWGVDYGLIGPDGRMVASPVNYRDARTDDIMEYAEKFMKKEELYGVTGIQFMNFNTIYQLLADMRSNPKLLDSASRMLMIPDLLNYFLTGKMYNEYTNATTGALIDAKTGKWAYDVIEKHGIPSHIFGEIVQPGTIVGKLLPKVKEEVGDIDADVVTVASHDTASAIMACPAKTDDFVYISSGTWSLMGTELPAPVINEKSLKYSITNEGGAENKICFLKNIMGLWIHTECRRDFARQDGFKTSYDDLAEMGAKSEPMRSIINPNDVIFTPPGNMTGRIADYCKRTGQPVPETKGQFVRCVFDSLALCYRETLERIEDISGKKTPAINVIGGGSKETLLCKYTADACGIPVTAGPSEATAIGNIASQAIACGEIKDLSEARQVIRDSFDVETYEPDLSAKAIWDEGYEKFKKLS
ncbi:MAG: rhamnulokinase [Ruminococcaceae bacterium]|nr:rhamnulokinase [Oscillospiraceae bacterium]